MSRLKEVYEERARLAAKDPAFAKVALRVQARLIHNVNSEGEAHGFKFQSDELDEAGGSGKGPIPLDYFLAGFCFCFLSIMARTTASLGVGLNSASISVRGLLDRRGAYGSADVYSGFLDIAYELKLESDDTEERVRAMVKEVQKRCPAHATLSRATKLSSKNFLNGKWFEV
ncbi:MAG: OsmC family protein [Thaumarchaeota archaeon]|nr:OsmC family protein [Nitrososphaerota archaeon]